MNSPLCTSLHRFLYSPVVLHFPVKFPIYVRTLNKGSSLNVDVHLSLKVPNMIYIKYSFPDYMPCQMEDSCQEEASNVSQGMKPRLDCRNQGY